MHNYDAILRGVLFLLFVSYPLLSALAQEEIGLNPPGLKWRKIDTPAGRVIFPEGLDSLAMRTAALTNYQRSNDATIYNERSLNRLSQIIQNQSTLPAGFSTPAPWRNEYYVTPPANMFLGPVSWTDAMELHEYRHAQQFTKANQGFTWLYKILFGQTGWLLNSLVTQPLWFREGDAVLAETLFTHGGRGRLPSFHMEYRAMRLAGYRYNYEKAHYNSFRNFVPNPYRIGYYMVTKARRDYGDQIWNKVLSDTYHKKGIFYPFSRGLKKYTGAGTKEFYNQTVHELDSLWTQQDRELHLTSAKLVSQPANEKYTNYRFPQPIGRDSIVVLKSALDLIPTYFLISFGGKEQKLFSPGRYTDDHVTLVAENGRMVWAESGFHERYINKDYSIVKLYDIKSGKIKKLTSRTRYFSPAISKDGTKIFVAETDLNNRYFNVVLDAVNGSVLSRNQNPGNVFLSQPRWMKDDVHVICIAVSAKGNALIKLNTKEGILELLTPYVIAPLSRPFVTDDYVYFSAGRNGINNIYALQLTSRKIVQITSVHFGAFEPSVSEDGRKLFYSGYTADGYRTMETDLASNSSEIGSIDRIGEDFFLQDVAITGEKDITDSIAITSYPVTKYNAFTDGLFNFYGWLILPNSPEYGAEVYTRNIMSTLRGTVGALYNTNENRFHYYARATYAAFYPIIELEYNMGSRHTSMITTENSDVEPFDQPWREDVLSGGIRLPFRLTQGTHNTSLSVEGRYEHYNVDLLDTADTRTTLAYKSFHAVKTELIFSRLKMRAPQQFNPQWGQVFNVEYREGANVNARRLQGEGSLFFPGIFRTHSLNFVASYKEEKTVDAYRFTDVFVMPRGYKPFPFETIKRASVNYQLPILYPDLALGSAAFIQRLRLNVFYDHAIGNLNGQETIMQTPGAELFVDFRLFRLVQMSILFRYNVINTSGQDGPVPETLPFQFVVTRFELAN